MFLIDNVFNTVELEAIMGPDVSEPKRSKHNTRLSKTTTVVSSATKPQRSVTVADVENSGARVKHVGSVQTNNTTPSKRKKPADGAIACDLPFKCIHCEEKFAQVNALVEHMNVHICLKPYQCSQCDEAFAEPAELEVHILCHVVPPRIAGPKPFKCNLCSHAFSRSCDLNAHKKNGHRTDKPFRCSTCYKNFRQPSDLEFHTRCHGDPPYKCPLCDKTYVEFSGLRLHSHVHNANGRRHQCPLCDWKFVLRHDLRMHVLNRHRDSKPRVCTACGIAFKNVVELNLHLPTHSDTSLLPCDRCGKFFKTALSLKRHQSNPNACRSFRCSQCDRTFASRQDLSGHVQQQHSVEPPGTTPSHVVDKTFACERCGKKFRTKVLLQRHYLSHDPKLFGCNFCGKGHRSLLSLRKHMTKHAVKESFFCTRCSEQFDNADDLNAHLSTHAGEYQCSKCNEKFLCLADLQTHNRTHRVVVTDTQFVCSVCNKYFQSRLKLRLHSFCHDPKLYGCVICTTAFRDADLLLKHLTKLHPTTAGPLIRCTTCNERFQEIADLQKHASCHAGHYKCRRCDQVFATVFDRRNHRRTYHQVEKPFQCSLCESRFASIISWRFHSKKLHSGKQWSAVCLLYSLLFCCCSFSVNSFSFDILSHLD